MRVAAWLALVKVKGENIVFKPFTGRGCLSKRPLMEEAQPSKHVMSGCFSTFA